MGRMFIDREKQTTAKRLMDGICNRLLNVKGMVVEDACIVDSPLRPVPVLEVRPRPRRGMLRCSRCGRRRHGYDRGGDQSDPPAAEILMTPATHATALVVTVASPAASRASGHALARTHADLEHGHGAQRRVDDACVLDHRAFDVEELVAYAVHQALFGCCFSRSMNILPRKRSSLTPTTAQRRTHTHENSNSAFPIDKNRFFIDSNRFYCGGSKL